MNIFRFIQKSMKMLIKIQFLHPVNFVFVFTAVCFTYFSGYMFIYFLLHKFTYIGNWDLNHVTFLYATFHICFGFTNLIMSQFKQFNQYIHRGQLDIIMIRPVNIFLQIIMRGCEFVSIGNIFVGIILLKISSAPLEITWNINTILNYLLLIQNGVFSIAGIYLIGATLSIYIINGKELRDLMLQTTQTYLIYPKEIYENWVQWIVTIIPLVFIINQPSLRFLNISSNYGIWVNFIGIALFILSYQVWFFCLRSYSGTGN